MTAFEQRTAAGEQQTRAEEIEVIRVVELALEQFEGLTHAAVDDRVEHFTLDLLARETRSRPCSTTVSPGSELPRTTLPSSTFSRSAFAIGMRRPSEMIVGDVIAADRQAAALLHRAVDIHDVIGRAAAHVDDQRAEILLIQIEHHLRGGERREDHVLHFDVELLHAAHAVFDPRCRRRG